VVNGQKLRVMPDSANALLRTQARETEQSRSAGGSKVIVFGKGTGGGHWGIRLWDRSQRLTPTSLLDKIRSPLRPTLQSSTASHSCRLGTFLASSPQSSNGPPSTSYSTEHHRGASASSLLLLILLPLEVKSYDMATARVSRYTKLL
jgi:hypothetical protein